MTPADQYLVKAGDLIALARAEKDPFGKAEYERLSQAYLRLAKQAERNRKLAEQAERNSKIDVVYGTPPHQPQIQQQQQPQPDEE